MTGVDVPASEEVLYAAYGDTNLVLPELLGRSLEPGRVATLQDVQLCLQTFSQIPDSVSPEAPAPVSAQGIISESWDSNFRAHVLKRVPGAQAAVHLHRMTAEERMIVLEEWNLSSFDWMSNLALTATTIDGRRLSVVTDIIGPDQEATPLTTHGRVLLEPLNGSKTAEVARTVRQNYLERQ